MTSSIRRFVFVLITVLIVVGTSELMAMGAWKFIVHRAVARTQGVDLSKFADYDPNLEYLLRRSECLEFEYAHRARDIYVPGVPKWELCANSMGFRGPEFSVERKPNTFRVVCVGDSHTMGQGVPYDRTFCRRFAERLDLSMASREIRVEAIDAGIWGYSSYQGVVLYEKYVRTWNADLVVVGYGSNDPGTINAAGLRDRYRFKRPGESGRTTPYVDASRSYLLKVVRLAFRAIEERRLDSHRKQGIWQGDVPFTLRRATPIEYEENMTLLLRSIAADGAIAIVLGIAIPEDEYRSALERAAAACNVPFIPTWKALREAEPRVSRGEIFRSERDEIDRWIKPGAPELHGEYSRWLTIDGGHPTVIGHQIIADELYRVCETKLAGRLQPPS